MDILTCLETSAAIIASKAEDVRKAQQKLDEAKHGRRVAESLATLANSGAKNQTLLNAMVTLDKGVKDAEARIIEANAELQDAIIKHDEASNAFVAARKIAGLDADELAALRGSTIRSLQNQ